MREKTPAALFTVSMTLTQDLDVEKRKRGIRRTAIVFGLIALFFYVGFMVLIVVKGSK
jgi:small neutral amino acid transporter SnatA (MarC family)